MGLALFLGIIRVVGMVRLQQRDPGHGHDSRHPQEFLVLRFGQR